MFKSERCENEFRITGLVEGRHTIIKSVYREKLSLDIVTRLNQTNGSTIEIIHALEAAGFTRLPNTCGCYACEEFKRPSRTEFGKAKSQLSELFAPNLRSVHYLQSSLYNCRKRAAIQRVMNYFWTERGSIGDKRTKWVEGFVDDLIKLGVHPDSISGAMVSDYTGDEKESFIRKVMSNATDDQRERIINEFLPPETNTGGGGPVQEDPDASKPGPVEALEIHSVTKVPVQLEVDEPEPPVEGVTFKSVCPFRSGSDSSDVNDALWDLIAYVNNALDEMDWESLPIQGRLKKKNVEITVEFVERD